MLYGPQSRKVISHSVECILPLFVVSRYSYSMCVWVLLFTVRQGSAVRTIYIDTEILRWLVSVTVIGLLYKPLTRYVLISLAC